MMSVDSAQAVQSYFYDNSPVIRHPMAAASLDINEYLDSKNKLVEAWLKKFTPEAQEPRRIYDAVRYSVFAGGKRLRPTLTIAACELTGGSAELAAPFAVAVEWVHTYSLIHDDLPCMDDDDYRRGKLTNHKVFGESTAVLAGDALLTEAFGLIASAMPDSTLTDLQRLMAVRTLSQAAGLAGMITGQVMDMESEGRTIDYKTLEMLHAKKTGAIIRAAVQLGVIAASGSDSDRRQLDQYASHLGVAFQIADDVLDIVGNLEDLGKPIGSDIKNAKSTYPSIFGLEKSKELAEEHVLSACQAIEGYGKNAEPLIKLAYYVIDRRK